MKKRIVIAVLCAALLVLLLPQTSSGADDRLSFLAVNDYLPPELINALVVYGGVTYIPSSIFTNYTLGIYYSYFPSKSTAYVYNESKQLFFELTTGRTYDGNDNEYETTGILWGGAVYLPLDFLATYFGRFTYRVVGSNSYGSILRIKSGDEALTDDEFFRAAEPSMRRYYQNRRAQTTPTPTLPPTASPVPTAMPTPTPAPTPTPTEKPTRKGDTVLLGLEGLPSAGTLELLRRQGVTATFFLRADEIRSSPDRVRQLACAGYPLGVSGADAAACEEAASLLWETARVRTVLAAMPGDPAATEGLAAFPSAPEDAETPEDADATNADAQDTAYAVTSKLEASQGDQMILFPSGGEDAEALEILLYYIADLDFAVRAVRETDCGRTPILP